MRIDSLLFILVSLSVICTSCRNDQKERQETDEKTVLYRKVHIIDVKEKKIHYDQSVLTKGSDIIEVKGFEDLDLERVDTTIECKGAFLLPAIADLHNHLTPSDFDFQNWTTEKQVELARDQLKFGIQAVLNPNNSLEASSKFKDIKNRDDIPYLYYTGPSLGPDGG